MKITFDAAKNRRNILERGLSFERAAEFDFETATLLEDTRRNYGERRYRAIGWIGGELFSLVFTPRPDELRVISLRKASRKERRVYAEETQS